MHGMPKNMTPQCENQHNRFEMPLDYRKRFKLPETSTKVLKMDEDVRNAMKCQLKSRKFANRQNNWRTDAKHFEMIPQMKII